ncbi:MAG: hypothetical protein HC781_02735, partial [Leptolyngbyaceae cyanobacterium CSU_1_4]|nr:hypothetical protein [Leptolyngbyaceae cyanobacterium CSU_1_4]
ARIIALTDRHQPAAIAPLFGRRHRPLGWRDARRRDHQLQRLSSLAGSSGVSVGQRQGHRTLHAHGRRRADLCVRGERSGLLHADLEGRDGLSGKGLLRGLELVWLRDRLQAYLVQVQGSAQLQMTDGSTLSVGYAGHTNYAYVSLGRELVNAGKFRLEELSLPVLIQYFQQNPADMDVYIPRNNRFVFFEETTGTPATGSLGVPVTAERSIATDKSLMPPGALAFIQTLIPESDARGTLVPQPASRYVLDQDTGGAIRGAGRVDLFMGTGTLAGDRAGLINATGQLYYLLLKE